MSAGAFLEAKKRFIDAANRDYARQTLGWLKGSGWVKYEPTEEEIDQFVMLMQEHPEAFR